MLSCSSHSAIGGNRAHSVEENLKCTEKQIGEDRTKRPSTAPASPLAERSLVQTRGGALQNVSKRQPTSRLRQLKTKKPMPHPSHTDVLVQLPGYTLSRSPQNINMEINTDIFFGISPGGQTTQTTQDARLPQVPSTVQKIQADADESIKHQAKLQSELSEMTVKLEQQQKEWEEAMKELQASAEKEKSFINDQHQKQLSSLQNSHLLELQALQQEHTQVTEDLRHSEMLRGNMEGELHFLRELLETTKTELTEEANHQVMEVKNTLQEAHVNELQRLEKQLRDKYDLQLIEVVSKLKDQHSQQLEATEEAHKQELNTMLSQFSDMVELQDKLAETDLHNQALEKEVSRLREVLTSATSAQLDTEAKLLETRTKLADLEGNFTEQVLKVETKYRDRIDSLMRQNADLRKHALHTSTEYCQYKASILRSQVPSPTSIRGRMMAVVQARSVAKLGVALGLDEEQSVRPRPLSAPETHGERKLARELSKEHNIQELRPLSCMPHFR